MLLQVAYAWHVKDFVKLAQQEMFLYAYHVQVVTILIKLLVLNAALPIVLLAHLVQKSVPNVMKAFILILEFVVHVTKKVACLAIIWANV